MEKPQGMLIAGKPLILNGRVYWVRSGMAFVVLFPIFTSFVPILKAVTGTVGPADSARGPGSGNNHALQASG